MSIERIAKIYDVEREAKNLNLADEDRLALRQKWSLPWVDELFAWMAKTQAEVLPKCPMGKALA